MRWYVVSTPDVHVILELSDLNSCVGLGSLHKKFYYICIGIRINRYCMTLCLLATEICLCHC